MPEVSGSVSELRAAIARRREEDLRAGGDGRVVLVPTMGALHAGHLALVRRARELGGTVVVSIFVNPLQFGPGEDLDAYPRTLEADVAALAGLAELVFAPSVTEMYPDGATGTRLTAGEIGDLFEGASRPGHFDGMLTVVAKLLNIARPDAVLFGRKDAQQVFLVTRMVRDLDFPVEVHVVETVREPDGLALSSRNRFLGKRDRAAAAALSAALRAGSGAAAAGVRAMRAAAERVLDATPEVRLDYLAIVDPADFRSVPDEDAPGRTHPASVMMLVAARVGPTRLIDNELIDLPGSGSAEEGLG